MISIGESVKIQTKIVCVKKNIWNPATSSRKNGKYVGRIIGNSVVIYHEMR